MAVSSITNNNRVEENSLAIQCYFASACISQEMKNKEVNKKPAAVNTKVTDGTSITKSKQNPPQTTNRSTSTTNNTNENDIKNKIYQLEKSLIQYPSHIQPQSNEHSQILRVYKDIMSNSMYSSVHKWVPTNYYDQSLSERASILGAHSTYQLCKSMLMENKAYDSSSSKDLKSSFQDKTNSRFYLVILQYKTSIATKKLQSEVRGLQPLASRLDPSKFDFRVASEEHNSILTGFTHNAVSPFGLHEDVPMILSKAIADTDMTQFIWLGGGHVHLKIGMAMSDLMLVKNPLVLDVTE